jgi:WD40 repeat protein
MGDTIDSKIYSVDVLDDKVLVLSQAEHGFREVSIFENDKLNMLISKDDKLYIAKAKFIDADTILLGLLSNDIISYDIKKKKQNWSIQASQSKFSNFVLSEDKKEVVICDESGDLHILDVKSGKNIKTLSGQNLDNVFQVDYKNGIIATAGQDRRAVIYNLKTGLAYYKTTNFLIYSVGLSPSGKLAGYASDENNNVTVFKTSSKSKIGVFGGNKMTLTNIVFVNENEFFVSSDDKTINFYKIK